MKRMFARVLGRSSQEAGYLVAMSSNVIELRSPRWRVLVAHQSVAVRHALRTLIEDRTITVVEAADGEAALGFLELSRFDVLVLELDLPVQDGVTVMQPASRSSRTRARSRRPARCDLHAGTRSAQKRHTN